MEISNFTNYKILTRFNVLYYNACTGKLVTDLNSVMVIYLVCALEVYGSNSSPDTSYLELQQPQLRDIYSLHNNWVT